MPTRTINRVPRNSKMLANVLFEAAIPYLTRSSEPWIMFQSSLTQARPLVREYIREAAKGGGKAKPAQKAPRGGKKRISTRSTRAATGSTRRRTITRSPRRRQSDEAQNQISTSADSGSSLS